MHSFGAIDFYETRKNDSYNSDDILRVRDLYLPLIGGNAFSLYCFLIGEHPGTARTIERILKYLQCNVQTLFSSFQALEAIGLVKTLYQEGADGNYFIFCMQTPLGPKEFLKDPLLSVLLKTTLGKEDFDLVQAKYLKVDKLAGFKDVSESYSAYFGAGEDSILNKAKERKARLETNFDYSKLDKALSSFGLNQSALSEEEKNKVGKYATLFGFDVDTIAEIVFSSLNSGRLDFSLFEKKCRASMQFDYVSKKEASKSKVSLPSALKEKIELMDNLNPTKYLYLIQNGHRPSVRDTHLLQSLAINANLPNPLINVIIDYALEKNNGILNYSYCENLGAILLRKGATNAKDAMDILNSLDTNKAYRKIKEEPRIVNIQPSKEEKDNKNRANLPKIDNEEDLKKFLEDFDD